MVAAATATSFRAGAFDSWCPAGTVAKVVGPSPPRGGRRRRHRHFRRVVAGFVEALGRKKNRLTPLVGAATPGRGLSVDDRQKRRQRRGGRQDQAEGPTARR
jgi:hypothetical protein